jgi:hypothetical protein
MYDGGGRVVQLKVPDGGTCNSKPCWRAINTLGYGYTDRSATADGVFKITNKGGGFGKSSIVVKAKDVNFPVPSLPLDESTPITVQFVRNDLNRPCWETSFSTSLHNSSGIYQARKP